MFKYADDTNVSEYIFNQEYTSSLQDVTNCIVNWSTYNKLAEELKRILAPKQQIYKKKSTSVGTKNQVESFLVILDSG
jgi:tRNA/tmRNA/rRNA uracil-C5-methylase (TrmA/RlmC/RlmD family)